MQTLKITYFKFSVTLNHAFFSKVHIYPFSSNMTACCYTHIIPNFFFDIPSLVTDYIRNQSKMPSIYNSKDARCSEMFHR